MAFLRDSSILEFHFSVCPDSSQMNLPAPEFASGQEADKGTKIGLCSNQGSSSRNAQELQTMTNVYKMRQEQEKILHSFNTPSYSLLVSSQLSRVTAKEFGAQNMLFFENLVSSIGSYISSESIVSSINSVVLHISCNTGCAVFLSAPKETKGRSTPPSCGRDSAEARLCDGSLFLSPRVCRDKWRWFKRRTSAKRRRSIC